MTLNNGVNILSLVNNTNKNMYVSVNNGQNRTAATRPNPTTTTAYGHDLYETSPNRFVMSEPLWGNRPTAFVYQPPAAPVITSIT
jgi:hypothetical protein